ncbi:protein kinase domain-containing protein [Hyalangium versicolor]|uniref:protein kinase domain-containing protein n=1 Tax=Hyalangium versicolor TaxID=2861190 RepID=UPI002729748F|nr:protein kinase [Hyalangium versicolor]
MGRTGEHDGQGPVAHHPEEAEWELEDGSDLDDSFLKAVATARPRMQLRRLFPGERLGGSDGHRFEIIQRLGEGTMGQVFRAHDAELQRVVALKFLFPREELEGMGLREARAIARLDHENIIRIFDVSEWRDGPGAPPVPFLVMECLQGESLAELLAREHKLELRRTLKIMRGVAAGLAHAHEHHIVHRDLKPSNVFLTHQGAVKLLDFGLAWLAPLSPMDTPQNLPSAGTPSHMAPEQWLGEQVDERTDIWAAGILLYELLTGDLPYPDLLIEELREKVLSREPVPPLRERHPELPWELESLLAVALAKDPAKRLLSAQELREELRELEEHLQPGRGSQRPMAPQRRQVTLVSCRLAGLSELAGQLDPEDFGELEATFHRVASEVIQRHGGSITLCIGDEVLACFGYPVIKEGDSESAVRAGLDLPRAVHQALQARPLPWPSRRLAVQVGIDTDLVVLDDILPELRGSTPTIQGEAPRIAAWLGRQAGPDEVVLGPSTHSVVKRAFDTVPLGTRAFDGRRTLELHRVLRARVAIVRFERTLAGEGKLSPLVGRERELGLLLDAWRRARQGRGGCVLVSGEAGIGKSRLLQELRERVLPENPQVVRIQCWSQFSSSALHPVIELLQRTWLRPERSPEENLRAVEQRLTDRGLTPMQVGLLAALVGLPVAEDVPHKRLTPQRQKEETMAALLALPAHQELRRPLLVLVEDLHWADSSTLQLLGSLEDFAGSQSWLLVFSARPEFRPPWGQPARFQLLALERLSAECTERLVKEMARGQRLPDKVVTQLVARTDGIPLFVEEMTRVILQGGAAAIPLTLHELLLARLDSLPRRQKQLAQLCAVVGRSFSHALLATLTGRAGSALRRDLAGLMAAGLLQPWDEEAEPGYQFRHALIQEAALQSLPRSVRRQHHQRIAQALEESTVKPAGLLAYHYLAANDEAKGLEYTLIAARAARRQYANDEAIHHYHRALEVLSTSERLPQPGVREDTRHVMMELAQTLLQAGHYTAAIQTFEQRLQDEPSDTVRAEIHVGLGRAFQEKGESGRAIQELERALKLMGHAAPSNRAARVIRTVAHLGIHLLSRIFPRILRPVPTLQRPLFLKQLDTLMSLIRIYYFVDLSKLTWATLVALNMAERARTDYALSLSSGYYGTVLFGAGLLEGSRKYMDRAVELGRRSKDMAIEGIALSRLGTHALFTNDLERAMQLEEEAIHTLQQVGEPWEVQTSTMILGTSHFLSARFEQAEKAFQDMGALGQALNALMHQGWAHSWVPICRYLRGERDVDQLCKELEQGHDISVAVGDLANQCAALNHLANIFVREHRVEDAARMAVRAFDKVWKYQVLVPFLQIGLVDAAEAALFALEEGATSVPRSKLLRIVRLGSFKARVLSRIYTYLRGPALRVTARALNLSKGVAAAEPVFLEAISILEKGPHRWELGVACFDAAVALPHRRAQLLGLAREIFTAIGAQAELRRVERLEGQALEVPL